MRRSAFALCLLTVFLLAVMWLSRFQLGGTGGHRRKSVPLPSGGRLVLWQASYGTNHEFVVGRFPQLDPVRGWRSWVPKWLGPTTARVSEQSPRDGLCLFYGVEDETGHSPNDPPWAQAFVDEHGCRMRVESSRGQSSVGVVSYAHQFSSLYPRRARAFDVEFGPDQNPGQNVRLRVANPRPWTGTNWIPEALPASREIEDLRVTMTDFGASADWPYPQFRIEQGGQVTTNWRLERIEFKDATGNIAQTPDLCRLEAAWRIEAAFVRVPAFNFGPDEAWTIHDGPVPGPGEAVGTGLEKTLQGVGVQVLCVGGPGQFTFESRGEWVLTARSNLPSAGGAGGMRRVSRNGADTMTTARRRPWVALTLRGLDPGQVWQVIAVDDEGHSFVNQGWSGTGRMVFCEFDLPKGTRNARFTLVLQHLRNVTFTVAPPPPRPP